MKKYIKDEKIQDYNRIIIVKDGMRIFNPTEEMILADGWIEYITSEPEITLPKIKTIKEMKIEEILQYDSSDEVNVFFIGGQKMWLDKATRVGLKLRFEAEIASGKEYTTLWHEGVSFDLKLANAIPMLNTIELYASACYDTTQTHISMIKSIEDLELIKEYNYKKGYPETLTF